MANPYIIPQLTLDKVGEAIKNIILRSPFGTTTYITKLLMEHQKSDLIQFWNNQGLDGEAEWNKYYTIWSMTRVEQDASRKKEKIDQFLSWGYSEEEARNLIKASPKLNPQEIVKCIKKSKKHTRKELVDIERLLKKRKHFEEQITLDSTNYAKPTWERIVDDCETELHALGLSDEEIEARTLELQRKELEGA